MRISRNSVPPKNENNGEDRTGGKSEQKRIYLKRLIEKLQIVKEREE